MKQRKQFVMGNNENVGRVAFDAQQTANRKKFQDIDMFGGLPYGNFILFLTGNRNAISISAQRSGVSVTEKETLDQGERKVEVTLGKTVIGVGRSPQLKIAKLEAFEAAMARLKENCFTIKMTPNPDRIIISKNNKTVTCSLKKTCEENKLDANNIGYKMMVKMGWTGGGLGRHDQKGSEDPVGFLVKNNRRGLGNTSGDVNSTYFRTMLDQYIKSDEIRDLYFESGFTKDERAALHQIASNKNLKSSSYGKEPNRHLVVSKKNITPKQIVYEVLVNKNPMFMNKYEVDVPPRKRKLFPERSSTEDLSRLLCTFTM